MRKYILLLMFLVAGQTSFTMDKSKTAKQYTMTDLQKAISDKRTDKVPVILNDLADQGLMTFEKYNTAMDDVGNLVSKLDDKMQKWDAPWWKRVGIGLASLTVGGYKTFDLFYYGAKEADKEGKEDVTATKISSDIPVIISSAAFGVYMLKNGWDKKRTNKKRNLLDVKGKLEEFKKNNPKVVEKISEEEIEKAKKKKINSKKKKKKEELEV